MEQICCKSYIKAIELLQSQGKFHISLGLERISSVLDLLGNPQNDLKVIHVAGTNGKGSTCAMLASLLKESGCKTGMYTSPHLIDYTERIKIYGHDISKENFASILFEIHIIAQKHQIHLTEFEILTAMAFLYFKRENTDIVILETGLGGRLDATNVVKNPLLSIITSISLDHVDRLGDTVDKIAFEKAGIIKNHVPVVTLANNNGLDIIEQKAKESLSQLFLANQIIENFFDNISCKNILTTNGLEYELSMLGIWQTKNLSLVLKSVEVLKQSGIIISEEHLKIGLKKAIWPARMQYIKKYNLVIDGAHNLEAAKLLRESLDYYFPNQKRIWFYGSLVTKDYKSIVKTLFQPNDIVICTESMSMKATPANDIVKYLTENKICNNIYINKDMKEYVQELSNKENSNCLKITAGSLYLAGDFLSLLTTQLDNHNL